MNWKKFMNEGDYQDFLLRALTDGKKGFEAFVRRTNADFCRESAMDKGLLIEFLEATQPETMAALSKLYKARRDATIKPAAPVGHDRIVPRRGVKLVGTATCGDHEF